MPQNTWALQTEVMNFKTKVGAHGGCGKVHMVGLGFSPREKGGFLKTTYER